MQATGTPLLPTFTHIDQFPSTEPFDNVKAAFNKRNYEDTIERASKAITQIQRLQLLTVLDHRAYAFGMKSNFEAAVKDAEAMITYESSIAAGYLRLGNLLCMQGKSGKAVEIYGEALEKVPRDNPAYSRLLECKTMADQKNEHRFDLVSALPLGILDDIITLLSEKERAMLLDVSKTWRERVAACPLAWATIANNIDIVSDAMTVRAIPYVVKHIKNLRIDTHEDEIWLKYLSHLENGDFKKIRSLTLTEAIVSHMTANSMMSWTTGLWKMRNTLTKLELECQNTAPPRLSDILFYCTHLKTLIVGTRNSLAAILGDLEYLGEPHRALIDMSLTTGSTSGDALKPLVKWCPNLRRLLLYDNCTPTILDVVYEYCENLELFGYNMNFCIPQLNELHNDKYPKEPGLRGIYTPNGDTGAPINKFMRLVYKHARTLERVYANIWPGDRYHPDPDNGELRLERLEELTYWADDHGVFETFLLKTIESCKTLKLFNAVNSSNAYQIADTLLHLPPIERLDFSIVSSREDDDGIRKSDGRLMQVFKKYAGLPDSEQKLRRVRLFKNDAITDDILAALAELKTIESIEFNENSRVTKDGVKNFIRRASKPDGRLMEIDFSNLDLVDDSVLELLCSIKNLEKLYLGGLSEVTDKGIRYVVDNAKSLQNLTVDACATVSESVIPYVNSKIKHVNITIEEEDDDDYSYYSEV
ncbi:hypothetical protein BDB00DRAFT_875911 [Zychaea mexicana]|uniref:uncharacterized protein n=1 Tax=Zychaea mexicana TaxID=64656 RepID=UPI0022FDF5F5|nr:uncharacterized protein BDB00DRAFT_875911 [Zychaea mexicana]KAI9489813.1 hypothetical protein BDB00DRAFT_875911 [Zychaea mexicana]